MSYNFSIKKIDTRTKVDSIYTKDNNRQNKQNQSNSPSKEKHTQNEQKNIPLSPLEKNKGQNIDFYA